MKQLRECVKALKEGGITVYMPAQHQGVCTSPYCAVQFLGAYPQSGVGTGYEVLRLHLYAPTGRLAMLEELREKTEKAMLPLIERGSVRPCEGVGACTVDDTYKAYACYIDYRVLYGLNP